ncbi:pro-sigmaK processing inhibitor BofA family protein [Lederbergia wuyishanensis]|uniref:Inhibitor of the pro-sigma K processing machinery n=1 Tax=Lederbergia wuyishanensis TaxID=1347903 RepID=A0ABU0DAQ8_9BACI|nr:pro-sigmaK processing inhibitor BofA family protein [Lederbergia wuyishanensis]MCJ8009988.1 pro-sigmaK processing inhibitor BofA family protein [Lederbergia wuyishanensis]MDQ0345501.1 inhibitor of the pro-sigma K processing machinery [Lederbergia wuyishanensis]
MESIIIISALCVLIVFLLIAGLPGKALKWIGQACMKLVIGALFLFFLNAIGNQFGIFVPINFATSAISGFLGIPGVAALAMIQLWIL